jgi:uncharacterized repeat protein (TIGR04138 family)
MPKLTFDDAVHDIVSRDPRYHGDAYRFLRDALDFTMRQIRKQEEEERHVRGGELLEGFKRYALDEFGPLARQVLEDWGVHKCEDVGHMVFNLIDEGIFGRSDEDRLEDFVGVFDFDAAFSAPFLPASRGVRPATGDGTGDPRRGGAGSGSHPAAGAGDAGDAGD